MSFRIFNIDNEPSAISQSVNKILQSVDNLQIAPGGDFIYDMPTGVLFKSGNTVPTPIAATGVAVKCVVSDNETCFLNEMEVEGTNKIVYTGKRPRAFNVTASVSASLDDGGGNNRLCNFIIHRNGVPLTSAIGSTNLRRRSQVVSTTISVPIRMNIGDYIEIWVENTESIADIIVCNLSIVAIALSLSFPEEIPSAAPTDLF